MIAERETVLPVGCEDASGRLRRTASLRKMRGHEEALLYDSSLSAGRLVTELVAGCLTRLGDETEVTANDARRLYSADRNYLLLEIRRFTLGDAMPCTYGCPACGSDNRVVEDLGRIDVRRHEGERAPESVLISLKDGYRNSDGVVHTELRLRLPRGFDEEFVAETAVRDPLRARDALILRCIDSFGSLPRAAIDAYGVKMLRDLTLGDRRTIYRAMDVGAPGVDFRRQLRCAQCEAPFEAFLEASNFFFSTERAAAARGDLLPGVSSALVARRHPHARVAGAPGLRADARRPDRGRQRRSRAAHRRAEAQMTGAGSR